MTECQREDSEDKDLCYCHNCDEEYWFPEDTTKCLVCGSKSISFCLE